MNNHGTAGTATLTPTGMRFAVDGWDPAYGTSAETDDDLGESTAEVDVGVELPDREWRPVDPDPHVTRPSATLFVDGVRRIDARVWIDGGIDRDGGAYGPAGAAGGRDGEVSVALCASYAAGAVCCCAGRAHLLTAEIHRGLFTVAPHASDIDTAAGTYRAFRTRVQKTAPLLVTLSAALQRRLAQAELTAAVAARDSLRGHLPEDGTDLLVVDGPLRDRQHLRRAIGFIKTHRSTYLPPELHAMAGTLADGQRTPVFLMGTSWRRYAWYLRLPGPAGPPWTGVVRLECSADLPSRDAVALAYLSQVTLRRYSSTAYKDPRAPQNLYPIGGLERELRRRLGDSRLLFRALRRAASA